MRHNLWLARRLWVTGLCMILGVGSWGRAQEAPKPAAKSLSSQEAEADGRPTLSVPKTSSRIEQELGVDLDEKLKAKKKREEPKQNFEIRAIRTSPSDSITYFKPNQWTLFHLALIANNRDETVEIRSGYEGFLDSPHQVRFRRQVHLIKSEERLYRLPLFLPAETHKSKSVELAIYPPNGVLPFIPPGLEKQPCIRLKSDQFLIVVLSPEPDSYRFLNGMQCVVPGTEDDMLSVEQRRYFSLVFPLQPNRPMLADTALAWTAMSYMIWDDYDPSLLSLRQREALLDWLHWGGQLIVSGGSAATKLEQSFLTPYLPADVVGSESVTELKELSDNYRSARSVLNPLPALKPLTILPTKPVYLAKLQPRPEPGVTAKHGGLVVERSVGRGRVVMTAFSLYQPELVNWRDCYDTFWREAIFKLPESVPQFGDHRGDNTTYVRVPARELSRLRYLARDLGAGGRRVNPATGYSTNYPAPTDQFGIQANSVPDEEAGGTLPTVAEWRDETPVASVARKTLLDATGIKIPPPDFVLAAAALYLVFLVPINWLVCRFGLRRPELAWLSAPLIILIFSVGIVEFAERNVGFDMSAHEIDVVEAYPAYARAHLTRFTCVYSGSRRRCEFRYAEAGALALPMATGNVQRTQNIEHLSLAWDLPGEVPVAMGRYEVHPRSIGMVRAEEMLNLPGKFQIAPGSSTQEVVFTNGTPWELWDCHVLSAAGSFRLGDLPPGASVQLEPGATPIPAAGAEPAEPALWQRVRLEPEHAMAGHSTVRQLGELSPLPMLELLEREALGPGTRLVGWMPTPIAGQALSPGPDRTLGFTAFVVHVDVRHPEKPAVTHHVSGQRAIDIAEAHLRTQGLLYTDYEVNVRADAGGNYHVVFHYTDVDQGFTQWVVVSKDGSILSVHASNQPLPDPPGARPSP